MLICQRDDIVVDSLLQLLDLLSRCLRGKHALCLSHGSVSHCCREGASVTTWGSAKISPHRITGTGVGRGASSPALLLRTAAGQPYQLQ